MTHSTSIKKGAACVGTLAAVIGLSVVPVSSASAAGYCGQAVCMYQNINGGGKVLGGAWNVCGYYSNLQNQGFNDTISSIYNWAGSTQAFWSNSGAQGARLNIGAYIGVNSLVPLGWNDQISSVSWTG